MIDTIAYKSGTCTFTYLGRMMNPFKFIERELYEECSEAIHRIVPKINMDKIDALFTEARDCGVISPIQCNFYSQVLASRYENFMVPTYEKWFGRLEKQGIFCGRSVALKNTKLLKQKIFHSYVGKFLRDREDSCGFV